MADKEKCCGTCKYNKPSWEVGKLTGYFCTNEDSENCGYSTAYDDVCKDWEGKE